MLTPQGHLNKPGEIETNRVKSIGIWNTSSRLNRKAFNKCPGKQLSLNKHLIKIVFDDVVTALSSAIGDDCIL